MIHSTEYQLLKDIKSRISYYQKLLQRIPIPLDSLVNSIFQEVRWFVSQHFFGFADISEGIAHIAFPRRAVFQWNIRYFSIKWHEEPGE